MLLWRGVAAQTIWYGAPIVLKDKSYRFEKPKHSKHHRTPEGIRSKGLSKGAPAQVRESYDRCLGELVEELRGISLCAQGR
jgi:hypothetical protein